LRKIARTKINAPGFACVGNDVTVVAAYRNENRTKSARREIKRTGVVSVWKPSFCTRVFYRPFRVFVENVTRVEDNFPPPVFQSVSRSHQTGDKRNSVRLQRSFETRTKYGRRMSLNLYTLLVTMIPIDFSRFAYVNARISIFSTY